MMVTSVIFLWMPGSDAVRDGGGEEGAAERPDPALPGMVRDPRGAAGGMELGPPRAGRGFSGELHLLSVPPDPPPPALMASGATSRSEDEESLAGQKRGSAPAAGTVPKRRSSSR